MGLQIGEIIPKKQIEFSELKGKVIAVDAFNAIYQFLTTIRQPDGTPLKDNKGDVTSHLSGLFYRNMNLILEGIKLVYVFDGEAPELKEKTWKKRKQAKDIMKEKYEKAVKEEDIEKMGMYARGDAVLDEKKIEESKELLEAMGIAVVQAPGEGEAQASFMVKNKEGYAAGSQDYDCLMFQSPKLIQNLGMSRKRKTVSGYVGVFPQLIELKNVLKELGINQEQLICLGILCGTDYNPKGVKGLGPKKSLQIVKEYKTKEKIFKAIEDDEKFEKLRTGSVSFDTEGQIDFDWKAIYKEIENPNVKKVKIKFPKINEEKIKKILLCHDFSENRVDKQLEKLENLKKQAAQRTLF